ncbi:MAG TPA: CYTH domain-containing protein [Sphingobium sp.]|nr:CYTH domain-containing protein [Sphingobium sp.]
MTASLALDHVPHLRKESKGYEIERRFLVANDAWRTHATGMHALSDGIVRFGMGKVRVRIDETRAWVTFKGPRDGSRRLELEYPIPAEDAVRILLALRPDLLIEKIRYQVPFGRHLWSVDVHSRPFGGLITAEVELADQRDHVEIPSWAGREITQSFEAEVLHWLRTGESR